MERTQVERRLKWPTSRSLEQLMKEVPILNTKLKRNVQGDRLKSKAKETAGYSRRDRGHRPGKPGSTEAAKEARAGRPVAQVLRRASRRGHGANAGIHAGDPKATRQAWPSWPRVATIATPYSTRKRRRTRTSERRRGQAGNVRPQRRHGRRRWAWGGQIWVLPFLIPNPFPSPSIDGGAGRSVDRRRTLHFCPGLPKNKRIAA